MIRSLSSFVPRIRAQILLPDSAFARSTPTRLVRLPNRGVPGRPSAGGRPGRDPRRSGRVGGCAHPLSPGGPAVRPGVLPRAAVAWTGCQQKAKVAAEPDPVGAYSLVSIDGNKVPCTLQHEGHTMTINSGSFSINADGTCSSKIALAGRDAAIEVNATYTREGQKLTMQWQGAGRTIGSVEGDTFTMNNEGMVFAYRK